MKTIKVKIDETRVDSLPKGRINTDLLDATTEADIAVQQNEDESVALQDAARFARRVRRRLGLSQVEFSFRINVPVDTIRNWEQGKRSPTGAAKALLKVLDKAPGAAIEALN